MKITQEEIALLKYEYPNTELKLCKLHDFDFVVKPIAYSDYGIIEERIRELKELCSRPPKEDEITTIVLDICLVWPKKENLDKSQWRIGIEPSLRTSIESISGFQIQTVDGKLKQSFSTQVVSLSKPAYWPKYTEKDVEEVRLQHKTQLWGINLGGYHFIVKPIVKENLAQSVVLGQVNTHELLNHVIVWPNKVDFDSIAYGQVIALAEECVALSSWTPNNIVIDDL